MGHYEGPLRVEALDDGRRLKLLEPYGFIDDAGLAWRAPAGAIVDGASIPRWLWSSFGPPLEGKYRNASVIHDYYCDVRVRDFRAVHRVFYEAMIVSGVSTTRAKSMYLSVRAAGPRWSDQAIYNTLRYGGETPPLPAPVAERVPEGALAEGLDQAPGGGWRSELPDMLSIPALDATTLDSFQAYIDRHDPPLDVVDLLADRLRSRGLS